MADTPTILHRDGPMIAGGMGYTLAELATLSPPVAYPSGLAPLDALTGGGLTPGVIWTVTGPPGVGVTSLVTQMAAHLAQRAKVGLANNHMATQLLRDRLRRAAVTTGVDDIAADRIEVASWIPIPDFHRNEPGWFGTGYDVLIIDCLDEMLRPQAWPDSRVALLAVRWLREMARGTNTALILTARADGHPTPADGPSSGHGIRTGRVRSSTTLPTCSSFSGGPR